GCRSSAPSEFQESELRYHTPPAWTRPEMKEQQHTTIPTCLQRDDGRPVSNAVDWVNGRRPELLRHWTRILGKIDPAPEDQKWFGDIAKTTELEREEKDGYTRIALDIPIEKDFLQHHLLLIPKGQGPGPFPAVIAWSSSTPDWQQP